MPLPARSGAQWDVEWLPDIPRIEKPQLQRKFRMAYEAARRSFLTDVAAALGGSVIVIDTDGQFEVVGEPTKQ